MSDVLKIAQQAKSAARHMSTLSGKARQRAIAAMPEKLTAIKSELFAANQMDMQSAQAAGLEGPLLKRLEISEKTFSYMLNRLQEAAALPDPIGRVLEGHTRPNRLRVEKVSVPLGVIGIIYESRPNVTTDAAAVCLKSGNAVILRGGSESLRTNIVLADAMSAAAKAAGLPEHVLQIIRVPGHEAVEELLTLDEYVDVLIPRGGKGLIQRIAKGTRIPVIKHYEGICHLYLAEDAPEEMAVEVALNSKLQKVEVCNALETLLIDRTCADRLAPRIVSEFTAHGVELRGCDRMKKITPDLKLADEQDWITEYLAPILSVKIVDGLHAAIEHINTYGSGHTDAIITRNMQTAQAFTNAIDSASVLVNASTRLSGGGDYGMGAVVGISTDKLHARGPVGPDDLTSTKWIVHGDGHLRD